MTTPVPTPNAAAAGGVRGFAAMVLALVWRLVKWILHWWTGTTELERLCAANGFRRDAQLVLALDVYFARSRALAGVPARLTADIAAVAVPTANTTAITAAAALAQAQAKAADAKEPAAAAAAAPAAGAGAGAGADAYGDSDSYGTPAPASDADAKAVDEAVRFVLAAKGIAQPSPQLRASLQYAFGQMRALHVFGARLDAVRAVRYSSDNAAHEAALSKLWSLLRPDVRLSARISEDWGEIGFQGTDPATDFRGMGVLGLYQLIDLCERYPQRARHIFRSTANKNWFGFAITGLNLTHDIFTLLYPRRPAGPVPNTVRSPVAHFMLTHGVTRKSFLALYALLFTRLNDAWTQANPPNVMSFKPIHDACFESFKADATAGRLQPLRD